MTLAAITTATPARALAERGADPGSHDDGFHAVLADLASPTEATAAGGTSPSEVAQAAAPGVSPKTVAIATVGAITAVRAQSGAGAGLAVQALLARLADGATSALAGTSASGADKGDTTALAAVGDALASAKRAKTDEGAADTPSAAGAGPVVAISAFLPGVAGAPASAAAAATALSPSLDKSTAGLATKVLDLSDKAAPDVAADATATPGKAVPGKVFPGVAAAVDPTPAPELPSVAVVLVGSAGHVAPARPIARSMAGPGAGSSGASGAAEVATPASEPSGTVATAEAAGTPSVAATRSSPDRETPVAEIASHAQPDATVPDAAIQTIARAVTSLAGEATAASSDPAPAVAVVPSDPTSPQLAPARSLTLQLTPNELGSVTVRLHLSSDGLDVHLAVADQKTLAAITHARDALSAAIGGNGTKVESLVILSADASSTSTAGSNESTRSQSDTGAGRNFSGGTGGDRTPPRQRDADPGDASPSRAHPRDRGGDRLASGVFV